MGKSSVFVVLIVVLAHRLNISAADDGPQSCQQQLEQMQENLQVLTVKMEQLVRMEKLVFSMYNWLPDVVARIDENSEKLRLSTDEESLNKREMLEMKEQLKTLNSKSEKQEIARSKLQYSLSQLRKELQGETYSSEASVRAAFPTKTRLEEFISDTLSRELELKLKNSPIRYLEDEMKKLDGIFGKSHKIVLGRNLTSIKAQHFFNSSIMTRKTRNGK